PSATYFHGNYDINNSTMVKLWHLKHLIKDIGHLFGSRDCGFEIEQAELDAVPETNLSIAPCGDQNMQEYLDFAMERNDLQKPENWETASELYMKLKEYAQL
ncbi:Pantothenate synthetase, partial [Dissostichus eleginoides]